MLEFNKDGSVMEDENQNELIFNPKAAYYNGNYHYAQGNKVWVSNDIFSSKFNTDYDGEPEPDTEWDIVHISEISFSSIISIPNAPVPSLFKVGDNENPLITRRSNFHYPASSEDNMDNTESFTYPTHLQLELGKPDDDKIFVDNIDCISVGSTIDVAIHHQGIPSVLVRTVPVKVEVSRMSPAPLELFDKVKIKSDSSVKGDLGVKVSFVSKISTNSIEENISRSVLADQLGMEITSHYSYEARPESNHHPVTLPLATGNTLCKYLTNKGLTESEVSSYKTNEYLGYVVKCNRVIALNPYVGKKHVKYTIHRDRLALSKTDNTVEVVDINNSWFGYDLSKHTTTTTNLVYEKMIDNNSTEDSTTLDLSGISGIISGIEHNVDMPLKVGLPSWEDDKQDTVTLVSDNTFNLANTTKNKIAIRVDENTILECIRVDSSYKIVEINGRRYTSINPSNI